MGKQTNVAHHSRCIDAGIKMRETFAGGAVVAESVVTTEEKEEGVAIVDIGSGVTDVAIYCGGVLCYMASIPMGGSALNTDIRVYDGYIPPRYIEKLKCKLGSALVSETPDENIEMRNRGRNIKLVSRKNLAAVIEARMTDIAEYVWTEIKDAGYAKKLGAGIVITGGTAELMHVAELFKRVTNQEVRTACAEVGINTESMLKVASPNLTLAVSLLLHGAKVGPCPVGVYTPPVKVESAPAAKPEVKAEAPQPAQPAQPAQPTPQPAPEVKPEPTPAPKPEPKPEPSKPADRWDDPEDDIEDDGDVDIKEKKSWFGGFIKKFFDEFKDPNEDLDDDERW